MQDKNHVIVSVVAAAVVIFVAAVAVAVAIVVIVFVFVDIARLTHASSVRPHFIRWQKQWGGNCFLQKKTETRINGFLEIAICSTRFTIHTL